MSALPDWRTWPQLEIEGKRYAIAPRTIAAGSRAEAVRTTRAMGCVLPTRAMVDAIWKAADCKIDPWTMARTERGAAMRSAETYASQEAKIQKALAAWELLAGRRPILIDGLHKTVVQTTRGRVDVYGWHQLNGKPIQEGSTSHNDAYGDYSEGIRLILELDADGEPVYHY